MCAPQQRRGFSLVRAANLFLGTSTACQPVKSFFYAESSEPKASIVTLVRHAIERKSAIQEDGARADFARLEARMLALESRLAEMDAKPRCEAFNSLCEQHIEPGGKNRPVD